MYVDPPIWMLKQICPCCDQGSSLMLYTCENCQRLMVICDEVGTIFLDPLNITLDKSSFDDGETCPFCKEQSNIRPAKDDEILAIGLTPNDYQ